MKNCLVALVVVFLGFQSHAQVIKRGRGKPVYVQVEDTASDRPFALKKHDLLQLNVFDLIFTDVSLAYEHFNKDGKKGYQLPLSINAGGLPDTGDYRSGSSIGRFISSRNRIFQTGFNYNYYFNGQDKVSLYMGLGFQVGAFYYWKYNYGNVTYTNQWGNPYTTIAYLGSDRKVGNNYSGLIHGGILLNPHETVTLNLKTGFGLRRYSTEYTEYTVGYFILDVSLGFKF